MFTGLRRNVVRKEPLRPADPQTPNVLTDPKANAAEPRMATKSLSSMFPEISPSAVKHDNQVKVLQENEVNDAELTRPGEVPAQVEVIDISESDSSDNSPEAYQNATEQQREVSASTDLQPEPETQKEPSTPSKKRAAQDQDQDEAAVPSTPTPHSNKKARLRTPQSARVVSADTFFPATATGRGTRVVRTPTHRTARTMNPYYSAPAGALSTPSTPTVYSLAKALFQRGSASTAVVGRTEERAQVVGFLDKRLRTRGKGALYLSGLPGTGKSALLSEVVEERVRMFGEWSGGKKGRVRVAMINCMTVDSASEIFNMIHEELTQGEDDLVEEEEEVEEEGGDDDGEVMISGDGERLTQDRRNRLIIEDLERRLLRQPATTNQTRHIVVLDELDHIMTKDQEVLFRIFQWAFAANSSLILFGIANALDLTDRFLPRLRSNSLTPQLLAFKPYTAPEIEGIIEQRLWSLVGGRPDTVDGKQAPPPLMQTTAIQLCARKTASNTGDLRKAFDLCRRAIETVEEEVRRKQMTSAADNDGMPLGGRGSPGLAWKRALVTSGSTSQPMTALTLDTAPRVSISHVAKVCSAAFGGSMASRIKSLNLHQKAVLCVLVVSERTSSAATSKLTVMKLFDRYTSVCTNAKVLSVLPFSDFLDIVSALESHGVASVTGVCGRKGLGASSGDGGGGGGRARSSKGGGGASASRGGATGVRGEDYSQRRIVANVHQLDLMSAVGATPLLRSFLVEHV